MLGLFICHTHHLSCHCRGELAVHGVGQGCLRSRPVRGLETLLDFTEEAESTRSLKVLWHTNVKNI